MSDREPLSGADNTWRRMGRRENLTTITAILWLDDEIDHETVCDRLDERLLRFDRFRNRVGGQRRFLRRQFWEAVDLDVETHVHEVALPRPADEAAMQSFVGRLMSQPLDERRPLWEVYHVTNTDKGGSAIVFRINHSVGDGFALLYVLLGLVDDPSAVELPVGEVPPPPTADETFAGGTKTVGNSPDEGVDLREAPLGRAGAAAFAGVRAADFLLHDEPETSLRGELGTRKHAAWTDSLDLDRLMAVKNDHDATLNDVFLAGVAGGVRQLLIERGEATPRVRMTIPVNLTPMAERDEQLGNAFGLAFVPLPIDLDDREERIAFLRDEVSSGQLGVEATLLYQLMRLGGTLPEPVERPFFGLFEGLATGVVSNVPGPENTVEFAGSEVRDALFWVPQAVDQGLGISFFTYDGGARIGVASDDNLLADPGRLATLIETELHELDERVAVPADD